MQGACWEATGRRKPIVRGSSLRHQSAQQHATRGFAATGQPASSQGAAAHGVAHGRRLRRTPMAQQQSQPDHRCSQGPSKGPSVWEAGLCLQHLNSRAILAGKGRKGTREWSHPSTSFVGGLDSRFRAGVIWRDLVGRTTKRATRY